jgi:uncharacterized protein YaiE (UPF0345 family)
MLYSSRAPSQAKALGVVKSGTYRFSNSRLNDMVVACLALPELSSRDRVWTSRPGRPTGRRRAAAATSHAEALDAA